MTFDMSVMRGDSHIAPCYECMGPGNYCWTCGGVGHIVNRGVASPPKFAAITKLCNEATPGPWYGDVFGNLTTSEPRRGLAMLLPNFGIIAKFYKRERADAAFCAAARVVIPQMLNEINRLEFENQRLKLQTTK